MSRELLKRVRDTLHELEETHYDLYWDIQAELDKLEQEPIPVGYTYKQKDCYGLIETVFNVDKPYITWHNVTDVTPVYTAPQKREPPQTAREMYQRGYAAAERGLKREPLSDKDINEERLQVPIGIWHFKSFEAGIKFAEKMHGIGVDDESHDA